MARNGSSRQVDVTEDLFRPITHDAQEVQKVQETQGEKKEIGGTQGQKGKKLKRINMAFSDANYDFITVESRYNGMTATAFVNQIIDEYKKNYKRKEITY